MAHRDSDGSNDERDHDLGEYGGPDDNGADDVIVTRNADAWHKARPIWAAVGRGRTAVRWCAGGDEAADLVVRGPRRADFMAVYSPGGAATIRGGEWTYGARGPAALSMVSDVVLGSAHLEAADVARDLRSIADTIEPGAGDAFELRRAAYTHALALAPARPRALAGALDAARRGGLPVVGPGRREGAPADAARVTFLPDDLAPVAVVEADSWSGLVAGLGEALALDVELIAARAGGVVVLAVDDVNRPVDARHFGPALDGRWPWLADALAAGAEVATFW